MKSRERKWWLRRIATELFHIDISKNFFEMPYGDISYLYTLAEISRHKKKDEAKSLARDFLDYINSDINPF